jgi:hypothetical protein
MNKAINDITNALSNDTFSALELQRLQIALSNAELHSSGLKIALNIAKDAMDAAALKIQPDSKALKDVADSKKLSDDAFVPYDTATRNLQRTQESIDFNNSEVIRLLTEVATIQQRIQGRNTEIRSIVFTANIAYMQSQRLTAKTSKGTASSLARDAKSKVGTSKASFISDTKTKNDFGIKIAGLRDTNNLDLQPKLDMAKGARGINSENKSKFYSLFVASEYASSQTYASYSIEVSQSIRFMQLLGINNAPNLFELPLPQFIANCTKLTHCAGWQEQVEPYLRYSF